MEEHKIWKNIADFRRRHSKKIANLGVNQLCISYGFAKANDDTDYKH